MPVRIVPSHVQKRDGRIVIFDSARIQRAIHQSLLDVNSDTSKVPAILAGVLSDIGNEQPTVEHIQDLVEQQLLASGELNAARAFIRYRDAHARDRAVRPVDVDTIASFAESSAYFPTFLQEFQFYDKYSRFNYELGRRETWVETVDRAVDFLRELSGNKLSDAVYDDIHEGILTMRVMPSMRLLAMGGEAARRNNIAIYNCAYLAVDSQQSFVEALIISMSGCGVGYSVEQHNVAKLAEVALQVLSIPQTWTVEDTSEGWAKALHFGLATWWSGHDMDFDFSLIRPAGAALRTKGGRASGPEPLRVMLKSIRNIILKAQGRKLTSLEAHDLMCLVGEAAVQGGVRRTAMISLFSWGDDAMRHCKDGDLAGKEYRWNANNSEVWPERALTQQEVIEFMMDMHRSRRGEPGIFNRAAARRTKPSRRKDAEFGTNPCVPGDTWVMSDVGPQRVSGLIDKNFRAVVNGHGYDAGRGFWSTGVKPMVEVRTDEGYTLKLTGNHKVQRVAYQSLSSETLEWAEARDLLPGDMVKIHNHRGAEWSQNEDGPANRGRDAGWILGSLERKHQITDAIEQASSDFYTGFLRGLFDADGLVQGSKEKGISVRLAQSNLEMLKGVQRMLLRLGIVSKVYAERHPVGYRSMPDEKGGHAAYFTQANHELIIANDNILEFAKRVGFMDPSKSEELSRLIDSDKRVPNRERFVATVTEVVNADSAEVYDCTVRVVHAFDANGLVAHNCGEVLLRPSGQFCNLSSVVCRPDDDEESLAPAVITATIIGTIQSMALHFPGLRKTWAANCAEERLLLVDLNGQMDCPAVQNESTQAYLLEVVQATNSAYASELGIPASTALTGVKPSGNSATLLNSSSGLHPRWAPWYVRNVRVSAHSPIFKVLQDTNAPMDPENGQDAETARTWVVHVPVASPHGAITRTDRSAVEQCEYWAQVKRAWCEHNPSISVTYRDDELLDLISWVYHNQDVIGGMAFLPQSDFAYSQAPYEEISKEEYDTRTAAFPTVDFSKVVRYEAQDLTTASAEIACSSGTCDLI